MLYGKVAHATFRYSLMSSDMLVKKGGIIFVLTFHMKKDVLMILIVYISFHFRRVYHPHVDIILVLNASKAL